MRFGYGPTSTDIAAQANVSSQGNCRSGWRAFETLKMTQLRHLGRADDALQPPLPNVIQFTHGRYPLW